MNHLPIISLLSILLLLKKETNYLMTFLYAMNPCCDKCNVTMDN